VLKMSDLVWVVTTSSPISSCYYFEGTCCLHL